jgi:hypothetical protein
MVWWLLLLQDIGFLSFQNWHVSPGFLELFEGAQACEHVGPYMQQLLTWGQTVGKQIGFDLLLVERLSTLLHQAGLRHVREQ